MSKTNQTTKKADVYQIITDRIIQQLEQGVIPWRKPWTEAGVPQNLISRRPYRGINVWLLASLNYRQNYFLTFKQVKELGGTVKKGEKSNMVVFTKWEEKEDKDTGEMKKVPFLRYYYVFNIAQCQGIPEEMIPPIPKRNNNPIEACDEIIRSMPQKPVIRHQGQRAFYDPMCDYINMPAMESFINSESYYGTLFHELIHSTGHSSRLNRKEVTEMKGITSEPYSIEELTAELGACYLKSDAGIFTDDASDSAAYIQSWLLKLRNDKRFIVYASAQAQRVVEFILGIKVETEPVKEVAHA
jgi:antirestriction protein ArdC